MRCFYLLPFFLFWAAFAPGDDVFPKPGWADKPNPIAGARARVGGAISIFAGGSPNSLNYLLDNNTFSASVFGAMYETLIGDDPVTMEEIPGLAERWAISADKKTFTFWINPKARWSDGKPVTAADVKWTFETILDPKNLTGPNKVALEKFESPVVLDERTIRFTCKEVHWRNLTACGGMFVLPKHAYEGKDFNLINFEFPVVSGPYRLGAIRPGISIALERRPDWWNIGAPSSRGVGNFKTLVFKVYEEQENAYEAFLKGEIDLFPVYMSRLWVRETQQKKFLKNWVAKQKITNYDPVGFQGFAMNMRRPPFNDGRVRLAMAHLMNREKCNATLMYNQYFLHRSYFEDLYDAAHPCPNQQVGFDKKKARELLAEAGWKANPATGQLEKDGKAFAFKFLTRDASSNKFLAIYQQDLQDVGIRFEIDQKDSASWTKDMDEFHYDMTWASWSSGPRKDPEGMWASKEAGRKASSNITGFQNPRVDALIEKQKAIFDIQERNAICREIDGLIFNEHPYVLLWNANYCRLLYWNKFGTPPTVLSKFAKEESAYWYWWADEDAAAELKDAVMSGWALPRKEFDIKFDEKFGKQ